MTNTQIHELCLRLGNFHGTLERDDLPASEIHFSAIVSILEAGRTGGGTTFFEALEDNLNNLRENFEEMKRTFQTLDPENLVYYDPSAAATNLLFGEGVEAYTGAKAQIINSIASIVELVSVNTKIIPPKEYE